jgi:hypothetical protein
VAELFTHEELKELEKRAYELAQEYDDDPSLRQALQLLAEAAGNVQPRLPADSRS